MWYIVKNGKKKEAFRTEGEAVKALEDYGDGYFVVFEENNKLQAMRVLRKMSQADLSKASGVPLQTITRYESGYRSINKATGETLLKLAKALNCSRKF